MIPNRILETNFAIGVSGGNSRQDGFERKGLMRWLLWVVHRNCGWLAYYLPAALPWDWKSTQPRARWLPELTFSFAIAPGSVSVVNACWNGEIGSICFKIALNVTHLQTQRLGSALR